MEKLKELKKQLESENKLKDYIHITKHTAGDKMDNFHSISTNCLLCDRCRKRAEDPKNICHECFAEKTINRYDALNDCLTSNTVLLCSSVLPVEFLPRIIDRFFRLESFGDLFNTTQVINYFNICNKNPYTDFTIWTKNPDYIYNAIQKGYPKPKNLKIIFSGLVKDKANKIPQKYAYFIDKIFNVWTTEEKAKSAGKVVNCGKKHCIDCLLCYTENSVKEINELLK